MKNFFLKKNFLYLFSTFLAGLSLEGEMLQCCDTTAVTIYAGVNTIFMSYSIC